MLQENKNVFLRKNPGKQLIFFSIEILNNKLPNFCSWGENKHSGKIGETDKMGKSGKK